MERCENCGSVLDRADRFCKNCGLAIATMPLPVPPGVSSGQHVPMMPGSPLLFNVTTVQGRSGFNGALSRGGVSPQTPVPPGINGGVLAPTIAGQFFAPMPPSPPRTNNHGPSGPLAQERFSGSGSQPPSDDTAATTPVEVDKLYEQMSNLAELFLKLFNAIPPAGRERELSGTPLRGKAFKGLVMSATNVYLSPSTQEAIDHIAPPGTPVRVFAQVAGQGEMPGHVWYRISKPSEPPRYIYAWPVINLYQMLQRYFQLVFCP